MRSRKWSPGVLAGCAGVGPVRRPLDRMFHRSVVDETDLRVARHVHNTLASPSASPRRSTRCLIAWSANQRGCRPRARCSSRSRSAVGRKCWWRLLGIIRESDDATSSAGNSERSLALGLDDRWNRKSGYRRQSPLSRKPLSREGRRARCRAGSRRRVAWWAARRR